MTTFSRAEIIPSSKTAKNLGQLIADLKNGKRQRVVISRNNTLEAVLLAIDDYEKIMEMAEMIEHLEIAKLIEEREQETPTVSFDEVLKQSGISRDEI